MSNASTSIMFYYRQNNLLLPLDEEMLFGGFFSTTLLRIFCGTKRSYSLTPQVFRIVYVTKPTHVWSDLFRIILCR